MKSKKWMNWLLIICGSSSLLCSCADSGGGIPFNPGPLEKEIHEDGK